MVKQHFHLFFCIIQTGLPEFRRIMPVSLDTVSQFFGDLRPRHPNDIFHLSGRRHRHQPRQHWDFNPCLSYLLQKIKEGIIIIEKLGDQKVHPFIHLYLEMCYVLPEIRCFLMYFRVAGRRNAEIIGGLHIRDKIGCIFIIPCGELFLTHPLGLVAPQRQQIADAVAVQVRKKII